MGPFEVPRPAARDGPSPRVAAVRLGPWVQSEAPRLSLGRGGEPRAHSVPRLLKRDLVAIPSGQLNTPLRAGVWLSHAPWRSATGTCSAASRRRAAWNTAWCRRRPWRATPQDTRCASPQNLGGCLTASPARITQNFFTNTRRVKHARRHAEARRAESSLGSLSVRT